jgi:hypothetical protein
MSIQNGPGHRRIGPAHNTPASSQQRRAPAPVIRPDQIHAGMFRLEAGGKLSDMVNLARAKDAIAVILESEGRRQRARQRPRGLAGRAHRGRP